MTKLDRTERFGRYIAGVWWDRLERMRKWANHKSKATNSDRISGFWLGLSNGLKSTRDWVGVTFLGKT